MIPELKSELIRGRRKAEGGRQKAEGRRRKAEGRRQKAEGGRGKGGFFIERNEWCVMSYVFQKGFANALAAPGGSKRSEEESRHLGLRYGLRFLVARLLAESLRVRNAIRE